MTTRRPLAIIDIAQNDRVQLLAGRVGLGDRARNLVDEMTGFLRGKTHFIHDRDPLFTRGFRELLQGAGVISVRLPPRSPNLNTFAERFVLSIKSECLSRFVILGERGHLGTVPVTDLRGNLRGISGARPPVGQ